MSLTPQAQSNLDSQSSLQCKFSSLLQIIFISCARKLRAKEVEQLIHDHIPSMELQKLCLVSQPRLLSHAPSGWRHLSSSLPRKSPSNFCLETQLAAAGDRSLRNQLSPWAQPPPPGLPLKTSIHCFVFEGGAALGRNVRTGVTDQQVTACLLSSQAHLISLFWSPGFSPLWLFF